MAFSQELVLQYNLAPLRSASLVPAHFFVVYKSFAPVYFSAVYRSLAPVYLSAVYRSPALIHFSAVYRSRYWIKQVLFLACFRAVLHGKNILFSSSHS